MADTEVQTPDTTPATDAIPADAREQVFSMLDDLPDAEGTEEDTDAGEEQTGDETSQGSEEDQEGAEESEEQANQEDPRAKRHSRMIAEMAERESAVLEGEARIRSQQAALQKEAQEVIQWKGIIAKAKSDPMGFLHEAGIDINTLTRQILNSDGAQQRLDLPSPEVQALQAKIAKLEAAQEEQTSNFRQRQMESAVRAEKERLQGFVTENAGSYPLLSSLDTEEVQSGMFEIMRSHWQKTHTQLDPSRAARIIEDRLSAYYQRLATAASKHTGASQSTQAAPTPSSDRDNRTLTKSHGSRTAQDPLLMSDDERRQWALEQLDRLPD